MYNPRMFFGVFAVIPATVLLTVSFFVLLSLNKAENKNLKSFGWVIVSLLWVSVILVLSTGIYSAITGKCPRMRGMAGHGMVEHKMMDHPMPNR